MMALCAALGTEFGDAKVFRPYRDVRFAKDKTPYKTHQGAFVAGRPRDRLVRRVSPRGVRIGGGFYDAERAAAGRASARRSTTTATAPSSRRSSRPASAKGFEIGGDLLKTTPRGYDADHPRIDLLRHKSMIAGHAYGFEPVIHTPELLDLVRKDWRATRPLVEWAQRHGTH